MSESRARVILRSELVAMIGEVNADAVLRRYVVIPVPGVGYLAPHETVASRYRTAAKVTRDGYGGWGSNMRESIARTLDAISDAMEGQG